MKHISDQDRANVLIQALPYIQKWAGKTIVVKYGGNAMISPELKDAVMSDIVLLQLIGINVVLDIEVQGARQVSEKMPEAVKIFFAPPSLDELERRLTSRGTETPEAVRGRLARARQEYAEADFYDYLIVNDDVEHAAAELSAIITAEHCRFHDRAEILRDRR